MEFADICHQLICFVISCNACVVNLLRQIVQQNSCATETKIFVNSHEIRRTDMKIDIEEMYERIKSYRDAFFIVRFSLYI